MLTLSQLRSSRNLVFWSLHAGGWLAYALAYYCGYFVFYKPPAGIGPLIAIAAVAGFVLSMPMRYIYSSIWGRGERWVIPVVLGTSYVTALVLRIVINVGCQHFIDPKHSFDSLFDLFEGAIISTYVLLCWSALYFGIKYYESKQQQHEAMLKAVTLAQEAQLKMLRYQLNPHFLFNTLNAISTLILDNQNRTANRAVMRLSEFLRYTLDQDPMKRVRCARRSRRSISTSVRSVCASATACGWSMRSKVRRSMPWCRVSAAAGGRERAEVRSITA